MILRIGSHRFHKYKKELVQSGLFSIVKEKSKGRFTQNIYILNIALPTASNKSNFLAKTNYHGNYNNKSTITHNSYSYLDSHTNDLTLGVHIYSENDELSSYDFIQRI
ncbi:MAG: hypothetical protein RSB70_05795 [Clostridium sp.]